jgi:solute carrier family 9B (sodium/hydrogen exchanger), member 1/2
MVETHDDVIKGKNLPRVGETVRSKRHGTLWRVMEKREVWANAADDPKTGNPRLLPAIYLCYWKIKEGVMPGIGKMMGYAYTLHDTTFETNWEIVNDK